MEELVAEVKAWMAEKGRALPDRPSSDNKTMP
jgi:hypothetical protein